MYRHRLGSFNGKAEVDCERLTPASRYGLDRDLAEKVLQRGMRNIEQDHLTKLAYVQYNLHLKQMKDKIFDLEAAGIEAINGWIDVDALPNSENSMKFIVRVLSKIG
ncbi:hypothetical protein Ancab_005069 [Ancistrocladus abbreviatus]